MEHIPGALLLQWQLCETQLIAEEELNHVRQNTYFCTVVQCSHCIVYNQASMNRWTFELTAPSSYLSISKSISFI